MIPHTSKEDVFSACEGSCVAIGTVMPFAYSVAGIARISEGLAHCHVTFGNFFTVLLEVEERTG
jgi:hypothetical protein